MLIVTYTWPYKILLRKYSHKVDLFDFYRVGVVKIRKELSWEHVQ